MAVQAPVVTPTGEGLGDALDRAADLYGGSTAVVAGDRQLTYAEFGRRVSGLGGGLHGLGVEPGGVVAVLSMNSPEHLECWLGIPRAGMVLNDLNYRLAPAELSFVLDDCDAAVLIVDDTFLDAGRSLAESCPSVKQLVHASAGEPAEGTVPYEQLAEADPVESIGGGDELAGIFYTGGTTGLPKGAMLTHANLIANAKHMLIGAGYDPTDRYLHAGPMFHLADGASTYAITWVGGRHVIVPAFEPEAVAGAIEAEGVTATVLVPTMINMLINHPAVRERDLSSMRRLLFGGSPMPLEVQRLAAEVFACDFIQAYGMTEAAPIVTLNHVDRRGLEGEEPYATRLRSAGTPIVGCRAEIRRDDGSRADPGESGEVWVKGPNVMAGYWRRPEETAAALGDDGWYRSGDAAYADEDGYLYIVDRVKDMIISGGENIYCTEVENAIYQHSAVLEAAVFGVPDEKWGERVHAVVVRRPETSPSEDELIEHCRELIAGYKLPRSIDLRDEPLPKSGAGKMLKRELREPYWEGQEKRVS
jgi:acyl-CoA synthetase (AMP-forming)/AMP-acid ligase II